MITLYGKDLFKLRKEQHGFPGIPGSCDRCHWSWEACPIAWKGQFQVKEEGATVILAAACDDNLILLHAVFECAGSSNGSFP